MITLTPAALALIVTFETGGREYYEQVYKSRPCWPGGKSGVTIGCGYDLAFEEHFSQDWQAHLSLESFTRLARCVGKAGSQAQQALSGVRDIMIPWVTALAVFTERNLPREIRVTLGTFPGCDELPGNAFGALVSLVFNRGTSLDASDRRREMLQIRKLIIQAKLTGSTKAPATLGALAGQFRLMKRLWQDDHRSDGDLVDRREAEARLIETRDTLSS